MEPAGRRAGRPRARLGHCSTPAVTNEIETVPRGKSRPNDLEPGKSQAKYQKSCQSVLDVQPVESSC